MPPTDAPLIARLRAADPAVASTSPIPDRAAVRRALTRRGRTTTRRRWAAIPVPVLGAALVGALVLAPAGTPALAQIVDRAAAATAPPPNAIIAIRSRIEGRSWSATQGDAAFTNDEQGWVRVTGDGDPLDVRSLRLRSSDTDGPGSAPPGLEETTAYPRPGQQTITQQQYDPRTGRTTTERGAGEVPRLVFRAHDLLEGARRGGADVRLDGERTIDGRRTYRLVLRDPGDGAPIPGIEDRTELYVDAETYDAVEYRHVSTGRTQPGGVPFRSELTQRALDYEELADTAENRRLLELRGPREPERPQP